eukprot:m51a1_g5157 hypothetical protein (315) ;mRNA; f:97033-98485
MMSSQTCMHCGKPLPHPCFACERCETALYCTAACRDAAAPAHQKTAECAADAEAWAQFYDETSLNRWKKVPVPGPADGIEVAVMPFDKTLEDKADTVHTQRISRMNHKRLLELPSALMCPAPALLGFPLVLVPMAEQKTLACGPVFGCARPDVNGLATRLAVDPRTGFPPGTVCGPVIAMRADGVDFKADPELVRLLEKLMVLAVRVSAVTQKDENGVPTLEAVAAEGEAVRAMLKESIEMCELEWRAWDVDPALSLSRPVPRPCAACGKPAASLACAQCHSRFYCNAECQKSDWPAHKSDCKDHMAPVFVKRH